jgi:hypothetical protein
MEREDPSGLGSLRRPITTTAATPCEDQFQDPSVATATKGLGLYSQPSLIAGGKTQNRFTLTQTGHMALPETRVRIDHRQRFEQSIAILESPVGDGNLIGGSAVD